MPHTSKHHFAVGLVLSLLLCTAAWAGERVPLYGSGHSYLLDDSGDLQVFDAQGVLRASYPQPRCPPCDVSEDEACERIGSFGIELEQAPHKPLLGSLCFAGAHSQVLYLYSPLDDAEQPVETIYADFVLRLSVDPFGLDITTDRVAGPDQVTQIKQRWPTAAPTFSSPPVEHILRAPRVADGAQIGLIGRLSHALIGHDAKGLYQLLAPQVMTYQGSIGRDQLIKRWGLDQQPAALGSEFWSLVHQLLNQPVALVGQSRSRAVWPWYSALALERPALAQGWHFAARDTALRAGPHSGSPVLQRVEHVALRLVETDSVLSQLDGWYLVETSDGERGYVSVDEAPPLLGLAMVAETDARHGWRVTGLYLDE